MSLYICGKNRANQHDSKITFKYEIKGKLKRITKRIPSSPGILRHSLVRCLIAVKIQGTVLGKRFKSRLNCPKNFKLILSLSDKWDRYIVIVRARRI